MSRKNNEKGVVILALFMLIILACRGESVGIDTINYYYNKFSSIWVDEDRSYEWLFIGVCDFIREIQLNPRCCIYFLSIVTISFLYAAARRFSVKVSLALFFYVLLGYYTLAFNIARQMAACSIMLYAFSYFIFVEKKNIGVCEGKQLRQKGNLLLFIFYTIIAGAIHISSLLFSLIYFLKYIKFEIKKIHPIFFIIVLVAFFAAVQVLRDSLLANSMSLFSSIMIYDALGVETESSTLSFGGFLYRSIAYVIAGLVYAQIRKKIDNRLLMLFIVSLLVRILLSAFYGNIYRLGLYLSLIDVIIYAKCFASFNSHTKILFWTVVIYFSYGYFATHANNMFETIPYRFEMFELF